MTTLLICHEEDAISREGLARWLASFSDLVGIIVLRETRGQVWRRIRRELRRVGVLRFLDVLAFRAYYNLLIARKDAAWSQEKLHELILRYPELPKDLPRLYTHSPNAPEAEGFIRRLRPEIVLARCKFILKERIFEIPAKGTWVMHPGICPEYRNAHGCFWALANRDLKKVGLTLLKIDSGVDTGPVYGYYSYPYDEVRETHFVIQQRVVLDNLDPLARKFQEIDQGVARPLDTSGRPSGVWGQPWLSSYLRWKAAARKEA